MARLLDIRVDKHVEDRGVGTMLVEAAIEDCERRGILGMDGEISSAELRPFPPNLSISTRNWSSLSSCSTEIDWTRVQLLSVRLKFIFRQCKSESVRVR